MARRISLAVFWWLLLPQVATAESVGYVTDAFGVYEAGSDSQRDRWAGVISDLPSATDDGSMSIDRTAPGLPETLLLHFGGKSTVAGGAPASIVTVVFDRDGNLADNGTMVSLVAADGSVPVPTRGGIAARKVATTGGIGRHYAWALTGQGDALRQSGRYGYRIGVSMRDLQSWFATPEGPLPAEETLRLATAPLSDASGNLPEDGIAGSIIMGHGTGAHTLVPGVWVDRTFVAPFITRDVTGPTAAELVLPFGTTDRIDFDIGVLRKGAPVATRASVIASIRAIRITLGPFTTEAGYYLYDGTPISVWATDGTGAAVSARGWLLDGKTTVILPTDDLPIDLRVVSPLGVEQIEIGSAEVVE